MLLTKVELGVISCVLSVVGYIPYIRGMIKGEVKPHIFSWIIWTLLGVIVTSAQFVKGAGPGAWSTGVATAICVAIVALTFKQGDKSVTASDWVSFLIALAAIPVWRLTDDPVWAIYLVTFVYFMAYWPTFRKSYHRPHEEALFAYILGVIKNIVAILAIQKYSMTTVFYVAAATMANVVFIAMVSWRRAVLAKKACNIPSPQLNA